MESLFLNNSLTKKKEIFVPLDPPNVRMYTCGPTVYDYATIGNFRTYVTSDILLRVLLFKGYDVNYVMNLTDVGHLTGDGDLGMDKVEAKAKLEKKSAWDIAEFYTDAFFKDYEKLNLMPAKKFPKATDHIKEQIELVKKLEKNGFTYKTTDGIYFDTQKFESKTGRKYGELSTLDERKKAKRKLVLADKKDTRDFALWKFSYPGGRSFDSAQDGSASPRQMEWESPWGVGFPGWHIECSAMSMKYLGNCFDPFGKLRVNGEQCRTIDIHVGGEDLRQTHHPNEIAQSEAATGKTFVKYWLHTTFLKVEGKKMSKSLNNIITVSDIKERGFEPLALRYLFLTAHYRDPLNFTWDSLESSQKALNKLREHTLSLKEHSRNALSEGKKIKVDQFSGQFKTEINDDLNTPKALAVVWETLKSNIPGKDKYELLLLFDEVLGLRLSQIQESKIQISKEIKTLIEKREKLRQNDKFDEADKVRKQIEEKGFKVEDTPEGVRVRKSY